MTRMYAVIGVLMMAMMPGIQTMAGGAREGQVDAREKTLLVEEVARQLLKSYIFADVAEKMAAAVRKKAKEGAYDSLADGTALAEQLTKDLRAVSHDGHLRIQYHKDPAKVIPEWSSPTPAEEARYRRHAQSNNYGFTRLERMPGNVGYLRLDEFGDPKLGGDTAAAAMKFLSNTDALIIDLRGNGGGHPGMGVLLATYLLGGNPVHLSDFYIREEDRTLQTWTLPYVPGPVYEGKPVFLLIGGRTFSAGEAFAYELQSLKRARTVGERTGGGAHPGRFVRVSEHFALFVPNGRPVNPITKGNWEGTGVTPDVPVRAEDALDRAHALALEALIAKEQPGSDEWQRLKRALDQRNREAGE